MKKLLQLSIGAVFAASASFAHATPVLNKLVGTDFDLYYEASDYQHSIELSGNTVNIRLSDFHHSGFDALWDLRFLGVVAHAGKSIKSGYQQKMSGYYDFGSDGDASDAVMATLDSVLSTGTLANDDFDFGDTVANAQDVMILARDGNDALSGFTSPAYSGLTGTLIHSSDNNGGAYDQLGMIITYSVSTGGEFAAPGSLSATLTEISFTFDTVNDPVDVPEPGSLALLAAGALALGYRRRKVASPS